MFLQDILKLYKARNSGTVSNREPVRDRKSYERFLSLYRAHCAQKNGAVPSLRVFPGEIEPGQLFLHQCDDLALFFLIVGQISAGADCFDALKVSPDVEFATQEDYVFKLQETVYMVELWNPLQIRLRDLEESLFLGSLPTSDLDLLNAVMNKEIVEVPPGKRGLTVPPGDRRFVQNRFKALEKRQIKKIARRAVTDQLRKDEPGELSPEDIVIDLGEVMKKHGLSSDDLFEKYNLYAAETESDSFRTDDYALVLSTSLRRAILLPEDKFLHTEASVTFADLVIYSGKLPVKIILSGIPDELMNPAILAEFTSIRGM